MVQLIVGISILCAIATYYRNVAKKYGKNTIGYSVLGFFMPLFPFLLFLLFITIGHLILGHDPKFRLGKSFVVYGGLAYMIFVFGLPQYLKVKWSKTGNVFENREDILDSSN